MFLLIFCIFSLPLYYQSNISFRKEEDQTWKCINVDDGMLACEVVDYDVDPEKRHTEGLSQATRNLLNYIIVRGPALTL